MEKSLLINGGKELENTTIAAYYLNLFKDKLIANTIDLYNYSAIVAGDKDYFEVDPNTGRKLTGTDLIEIKKKSIRNAKRNIEFIKELLAKVELKEEQELWSEAMLNTVVSPIQAQDLPGKNTEGN